MPSKSWNLGFSHLHLDLWQEEIHACAAGAQHFDSMQLDQFGNLAIYDVGNLFAQVLLKPQVPQMCTTYHEPLL